MARIVGSGEFQIGPSLAGFQQKARAGLARIRLEKEVSLTADTTQASAEIAAWTRRPRRDVVIGVRVNEKGFRDAENSIRRVEHTYRKSALSKAIRVNVVVAGAAALPALAQGALSATTAVTELGQSLLLLPGLLAGAAAAVGTLLTGFSGLGAAFSAASKGSQDASKNAADFAKASRDLEKAQKDVRKALRDANRELEDQGAALRETFLDQEQAAINVAKARESLAKGGFDNYTDYRQAVLDVNQALADQARVNREAGRTTADAYEALAKGATGSDAFTDSVATLNDTIRDYSEAQKAASGMSSEFIAAMAKLSPAAQDLVTKVRSLSGSWDVLSKAVSQDMFVGVGDAIVDLADRRLPLLQSSMQNVAKSVNGLFKDLLGNIGSDQNSSAIAKIFENTAKFIDKATPGLNSFVDGFLHLAEVGSRFLPRLGDAFSDLMGRFERWVQMVDADGSLERWIDKGLLVIGKLGDSILSIGSILESVTKAYETATGNIGGFATTAADGLGKLAGYLKSAKGQSALVGYIKKAGVFLEDIKKALPGIIDGFQSFSEGARAFAQIVFPIFSTIGNFLADNITLTKTLFGLWLGLKTITPLWRGLSKAYDRSTNALGKYVATGERANAIQRNMSTMLNDTRAAQSSATAAQAKANAATKASVKPLKDLQSAQKALTTLQATAANTGGRQMYPVKNRETVKAYKERIAAAQRAASVIPAAEGRVAAAQLRANDATKEADTARRNASTSMRTATRLTNSLAGANDFLAKNGFKVSAAAAQVTAAQFGNVSKAAQTASGPTGIGRLSSALGKGGSVRLGAARAAGGLIGALGSVGGIIGGAALTGTLIYALYQLQDAHQRAGEQADYQRRMVQGLRDELDKGTGSVTAAGNQLALEQGQKFQVPVTNKPNGLIGFRKAGLREVNAVSDANKLNISNDELAASADPDRPGFMEATTGRADADTLAAIRANKDNQYNTLKEGLNKFGVTDVVWAKAVNGDGASLELVNKAYQGMKSDLQLIPGIPPPPDTLPDVGLARNNLIDQGVAGVSVGNLVRTQYNSNLEGARDTNQLAKPASLKPAGSAVFPGASQVQADASGQTVSFEITADSAKLAELEDKGIDFEAAGRPGVYLVHLSRDQLPQYVDGYARGGPVWGAGSATSDSIPARLSNGEHVWSAEAVQNAGGSAAVDQAHEAAKAGKFQFAKGGPVGFKDGGNFNPDMQIDTSTTSVARPSDNLFPISGRPGGGSRIDYDNYFGWMEDVSGRPGGLSGHWSGGPVGFDTGGPVGPFWKKPAGTFAGATGSGSISGAAPSPAPGPGLGYRGIGHGEAQANPNSAPDRALRAVGRELFGHSAITARVNSINDPLVDPSTGEVAPAPQQLGVGGYKSAAIELGRRAGQLIGRGGDEFLPRGAVAAPKPKPNITFRPGQTPIQGAKAVPGASAAAKAAAKPTLGRNSPGLRLPQKKFTDPRSVLASPSNLLSPRNGWARLSQAGQTNPLLSTNPRQLVAGLVIGTPPAAGLYAWGDSAYPKDTPGAPATPPPGIVPPKMPSAPPTGINVPKMPSGPAAKKPPTPAGTKTPEKPPASSGGGGGSSSSPGVGGPPVTSAPASSMPTIPTIDSLGLPGSYEAQVPSGIIPPAGSRAQAVIDFARQADNLPYKFGGFSDKSFDCTGLAAALANIATGQDPFGGGRFATGNEGEALAARGFMTGTPPPGALVIGWTHNGERQHSGITLPDGQHIDAQSDRSGIVMGEGSPGATGFQNTMYLPPEAMGGVPAAGFNIPGLPPGVVMPGAPGQAGAPGGGFGGLGSMAEDGSIMGPYGKLPFNPLDFSKRLGEIAMQFVGGFLGIDFSQITEPINSILGGVNDMKGQDGSSMFDNSGEYGEQYAADMLPGNGYGDAESSKEVTQLVQEAEKAKALGDTEGAKQYLELARQAQAAAGVSQEYVAGGGAEQWRPMVQNLLQTYGPQAGITNARAWENAIIKQIETESHGDPTRVNPKDSDGLPAYGLLQYKKDTFSGLMGDADIWDPAAQITGLIRGAKRDADGNPVGIGNGGGWSPGAPVFSSGGPVNRARGGPVWGAGSATSDSIPARLSNGEHVWSANAVKNAGGMGAVDAAHKAAKAGKLQFADGGSVLGFAGGGGIFGGGLKMDVPLLPGMDGGTQPPGPLPLGPPPAQAPVAPPPAPSPGPAAGIPGGIASAPTGLGPAPLASPDPTVPGASAEGAPNPDQNALLEGVTDAASQLGSGVAGSQPGAEASPGADGNQDPRSILGAQPETNEHLNPAIKGGIEGAATTIGSIASMAASSANLVAPGAGSAAGAGIQAGAQMAGAVASGLANVIASGLVGTLTGGTTGQGYGAPLLPQQAPQSPVRQFAGPQQNNTINVQNNNDWLAAQKRYDAQQAAGFMNRLPT